MNGLGEAAPIDGNLGGWTAFAIVQCVLLLLYGLPGFRIMQRSGNPGWLGLMFAVPFLNLVAFWGLAFARWPVENPATASKGHK